MITTLYKLTNESLLSWSIAVENKIVMIEHGQSRGKKQIDTHTSGTIALAFEEMERRIAHKINHQGYTYDQPTEPPRLPMLAHIFAPQHLVDTLRIQPKLDGIRCIGCREHMITRRGELINSMPHIKAALSHLPPGIQLDGEIYQHDASFQEHLSVIKRDTAVKESSNFKYCVFDVQHDSFGFDLRYKLLTDLIKKHFPNKCPVQLVPTLYVKKNDIALTAHKHYHMFEGVILRNPDGLYKYNTRSTDVQKYKFTNTDECQIIDIRASTTGREEGAAIFVCILNGRTFDVRPKMSLYVRKGIFEQKTSFIGRWTRITYEGLSNNGKPLKARAEGLENNKEDLQ